MLVATSICRLSSSNLPHIYRSASRHLNLSTLLLQPATYILICQSPPQSVDSPPPTCHIYTDLPVATSICRLSCSNLPHMYRSASRHLNLSTLLLQPATYILIC
ncbi:hypothetical protein RRG08_028604 [Elysia crispata]|uniref:Uncharacterized protein n=1 Tax=Elysia crispata TaxID=231223 RepID=A0AAE0ZTA9_9GAST|nr:hypothetical protein RRG08_028604 [Elysia crispata]